MYYIVRSWNIFKISMSLIMKEKKLLVFPLISALAMAVLIALIAVGGFAFLAASEHTAKAAAKSANTKETMEILEMAGYFVVYLATMFVANFCNTAFFHEIFHGLRGETISVGRGFSFAVSRIGAIFLWSLLASTVGVLLNVLRKKANFLGKIILTLVGYAWAVVSCFAVPVLVFHTELTNPIQVLRCSGAAIKRTWGEALVGFVGLGAIQGVATIGLVLSLVGGGFIILSGYLVLGLILSVTGVLSFLVFCYFVATAEHVYQAALYLYAEQGNTTLFPQEVIDTAFLNK